MSFIWIVWYRPKHSLPMPQVKFFFREWLFAENFLLSKENLLLS